MNYLYRIIEYSDTEGFLPGGDAMEYTILLSIAGMNEVEN
jgi:hypothetical protein